MAWVKASDTSATYPRLMNAAALPGGDDRLLNEVAGFVFRLACLSGAHFTDYVVPWAQVQMVGGARAELLVQAGIQTGLLSESVTADGFRAVTLINDPDFLNLITSEQRYQRAEKNKDLRDPWLKAMVIYRDGDNCRWCSVPVAWEGRTSARSGELDHLSPDERGNPDSIVVACKKCNSARQDRVEEWDETHDLLSIPLQPRYGKFAVKLFRNVFGDDWESRLVEVATSTGQPPSASAGPSVADPGRLRTPASAGPTEVTPAEEGPRADGASVGSGALAPGESNSPPVATPPRSNPGVISALDSHPSNDFHSSADETESSHNETETPRNETESFLAVSKPVLPGRVGTGFGPGSGTVRDGPVRGGLSVSGGRSVSGRRKRRR